jgi:hypothetical protein
MPDVYEALASWSQRIAIPGQIRKCTILHLGVPGTNGWLAASVLFVFVKKIWREFLNMFRYADRRSDFERLAYGLACAFLYTIG